MSQTPTTRAGELVAPIKDLSEPASEFVSKITGAVADGSISVANQIFGGLIGDRVAHWRNRNLVNILEKSSKHMLEKGVTQEGLSKLPNGDLYTIFEESSKCDNEDVQEMWASLIVSSASGSLESRMLKSYAETLKQLGSDDVKILMFLNTGSFLSLRIQRYESSIYNGERKLKRGHFFSNEESRESLEAKIPVWKTSLQNDKITLHTLSEKWLVNIEDEIASREHLLRLGCISLSSEFDVSQAIVDITDQFEGIVEFPSACGIDEGGFDNLMTEVSRSIHTLSGRFSDFETDAMYNENAKTKRVPYELTDYGSSLVRACNIEAPEK